MIVMKFGGSSVADAERIRHVSAILKERSEKQDIAVVFSAMKGITDLLIECAQKAESGNREYTAPYTCICNRTNQVLEELFSTPHAVHNAIAQYQKELNDILHGIDLVRECSPRSLDVVLSFGERMNNRIIAAFLDKQGIAAEYIDARELIVTDSNYGNAAVLYDQSSQKIRERLTKTRGIPVITGFIASNARGITTTLGRNGSDYTATLIGAAINAERVEIWTDVDGVLSADPRFVPGAFVQPEISVEDAMELSFFGAEVIHPFTMIPAMDKNIDIYIKNTHAPHNPGTRISKSAARGKYPITGIASIEGVAIINIIGGGMLGMPGVASRLFQILSDARINIVMISQASSEHSMCVVVREKELAGAERALNKGLSTELSSRKIQRIDIQKDLEIMAIVGENMKGTPGVSGRLFSALGNKKINVLAIAQGSSEHNISFVIEKKDRRDALNTVHDAFFTQ